ncbi:MAG: MFS transporter [Bacteroidia bacterium]|nr:MFS transporter [Bacteroidia bacterium]
MDNSPKLYTPTFLLLSASHFLFAASFAMIIPELPSYLASLGGGEYKGLIISLFTLTAGLSRPFSGKLTDTIGRRPVLIIGTLVCVVCSLFYPLISSVFGFLALRFVHGFSTGFKPTANIAYVADIVPEHRRGEAMGIMGMCMNAGGSIAPPIGSWLTNQYNIDFMFYSSSFVALLSVLILLTLKETLPKTRPFTRSLLILKKTEIIDSSAIAPAIITLLTYFAFGGMLTIVPDQTVHLGMTNKGLYMTSFTAMIVASRLIGGRLADIYGRTIVIKWGTLIMMLSLLMFGYSWSPSTLLLFSGFVGIGYGLIGPAIFAWATDLSDPNHRGRAFATVYIALEAGIGLGALLSAWFYDDNPQLFAHFFIVCAFICLLGLIFMWKR